MTSPLSNPTYLPAGSLAQRLSQQYRDEVVAKLSPSSILPTSILEDLPRTACVLEVPETCGILSSKQIAITKMGATELLKAMATGQLKSVDVVQAFGIRAAIAHQLTCCLTDIWLDEALVRAKELDNFLEREGKPIGPLHGLPISLKDQVNVKGKITSLSFISIHKKGKACEQNAQLAQILYDAGAIFYCHTTLPQTIMHLESESFWGRTLNPFNTLLSAGGSSGGEGALLAMRGSPLGIGTDIGGSVRGPAGYCGLYGLRPTAQRVPNKGVQTYVPGRDSILGIVGPLAHSLEDIELFMGVVLAADREPWREDPALLEVPWQKPQDVPQRKKLKIGVMWEDGEVRPVKPIRRVLQDTVDKLRRSGKFNIVNFEPFRSREAWTITKRLYFPDGGARAHQLLDQADVEEPLHPLSEWLLADAAPINNIHDLWDLNVKRDSFRTAWAHYYRESGVDLIICPAGPAPSSPHGEAKWWSYTSFFNLVDAPAIAFPTGQRVQLEADAEEAGYEPRNADEEFLYTRYKSSRYVNAPIGLQLVSRKNHDEELLAGLRQIESVLREQS